MLPPVQLVNAGDSGRRRTDALSGFRYRFHKIMLPFVANELRLPKKFSQRYGVNLSPIVKVIAPTERVWFVTLMKPDNEIWFREGWPEFVRHHAIKVLSWLAFTYEGDSSFRVHIYDPSTALRRKYVSEVPSISEDEDPSNDCLVVDEKHDEAESSVEIIGSPPHPCPGLASRSEMQKPLPPPRRVTRSQRESYPTRSPPTRKKMPKQHPTPGTGAQIEVCQPHLTPRPITRNQVHKRQPTPGLATSSGVHKSQPIPRLATRSEVHKRQPTATLAKRLEVCRTHPTPRLVTRSEARKTLPTPRPVTRSEARKPLPTPRLVTRSEARKILSTPRLVTRSEARKTLPTPRLVTRSELGRPHPTSRPATTNVNHAPHLTLMPAVRSESQKLCATLEPATNSTMLELYPTRRLSKRIETLKRGRLEESCQSKRAKNVEEGGVHSSPVDEDLELCYVGGNAETPASAGPIRAAGFFSSQNPFFMVTLRPDRCGRFTVNFPTSFAQKYLSKGLEHIKLKVANGRQQLIHCTRCKEVPKCLGEGWPAFVLDHGLVEDDVCIFELIENHGDDVLFQVHTIVVCG